MDLIKLAQCTWFRCRHLQSILLKIEILKLSLSIASVMIRIILPYTYNESNICHLLSLFFLLYSSCNKAFWNCVKSLTTFYALVYKLLGFMLQNTSFYSLFVRNKRWQRKNIVSIKEKGHCKNYGICKYMYPFKKIKFLYSYPNRNKSGLKISNHML